MTKENDNRDQRRYQPQLDIRARKRWGQLALAAMLRGTVTRKQRQAKKLAAA